MLRQLNNRVTVLRRISMSQPGRLPQTLAELDAIVAAIEQGDADRSEEHTSELQSPCNLVCRLLLEKKKIVCAVARVMVHTPQSICRRCPASTPTQVATTT